MIIKDIFKKDITRTIEGVVTIGNEDEEQKWQELEEYVCTDEITKCMRTFFRRYRESINHPMKQMGVWITGFFGSGKSHFLKILGYILENEEVAGVHAADYFNDKIDDQMVLADIKTCAKANNKVVLFNIDSKAKSDSKTRSEAIMDIMLRAFNESVGYCGTSPWVADLERTLDTEGKLQEFIAKFEEYSGRNWKRTRAKALLNRDYIIKALVASRGMTEESAKTFIDDQTRNFTNTTEDFAKIVNDYCEKNSTRVIFLMDEVGQFIGDNTQIMLNLQTCVEDLGKFCHGKAWVVITSQQELKAMIESTKDKQQDFSKIQGRFDTRLLLSGANADEVIKRRILEKKEIAETPLRSLYDANSSKLSNLILFQAKPTWSGYKDAEEFKDVYPFVSYQFELLQKVFEAIREHGMSEGKHISQNERSLLSAFQKSAQDAANEESGILIPFDSFYSTAEEFIDYDIKTVFSNAERRAGLDPFAIRVLRLLFMIKHVKEMPATLDRLATLMVDSIHTDKAALKNRIAEALSRLEEETLIQKNGDEYDFLTNEEQDVNKQINNSAYNEGEVQRTISDIIYEKILETGNKFRYEGRYDFKLNRYVDNDIKGPFNQENITIKMITQFTGSRQETEFQAESVRSNSIVVDLTEGAFIDELIRANKIATFKNNNRDAMSATLTEIMSKKSAEISDRTKRAEDIIRASMRTAPIYLCGVKLDIKAKDGKDRLQDALKKMVEHEYYKLPLVSYFYPDQRTILNMLNDETISLTDDVSGDANSRAYDEICRQVKEDMNVQKTVTVKSLIDCFSKKPYGWRDLDIQGMIAVLWKHHKLQIFIHDNEVEEGNRTFKNDIVRKNNTDIMVVRIQEKIDEQVLYQVKRIMNDIFSENLQMEESVLKDGVKSFFGRKCDFLRGLRQKYGSNYAGSAVAADIYNDLYAVLSSSDTLAMFNELIARKEALEDNVEVLEQLEAFYRAGSSQQKNYQDAKDICRWYDQNQSLQDLSEMAEVVRQIKDILAMDMPFSRMSDLGNFVFKANAAKQEIVEAKLNRVKTKVEGDRDVIGRELEQTLETELTDDQKSRLQEQADDLMDQYKGWLESLSVQTVNMDSYVTASTNAVTGFRTFITELMNERPNEPDVPVVRKKHVRIIDCVPTVNKRITSEEDVEKVLEAIRNELLFALRENDELDLG